MSTPKYFIPREPIGHKDYLNGRVYAIRAYWNTNEANIAFHQFIIADQFGALNALGAESVILRRLLRR